MKLLALITVTILLVTLGVSASPIEDHDYDVTTVTELLATPDKFHGKKVLVDGFWDSGFEKSNLYVSKEEKERIQESEDWRRFIWLDLGNDYRKRKWIDPTVSGQVVLIGVFESWSMRVDPDPDTMELGFGHMGVGKFRITNITYLKPSRLHQVASGTPDKPGS